MKCPKCQLDIPDGSKFCNECGSRIESNCPKCGNAYPIGSKFCNECGSNLSKLQESPSQKATDTEATYPMKIKKALFITLIGIGLFSSSVSADRPAPANSYKKIVADGRYVFVMLRHTPPFKPFEGYTISGLYQNDGSKKPLWTVGWYAHNVEIASDGVHLVKHGPWASNQDQEALSFYSNGFLLRSYKINELVSFPSLMPHTVSHFFWRSNSNLDEKRLIFRLTTLHGDYYAFDVSTGKIVSSFMGSIWLSIIITLILLLIARLSRKLFICLLVIISGSIFLLCISFIWPIVIFLGLFMIENIIAILSSKVSQKYQEGGKSLSKGRRLKFLIVFASIIFILIADLLLTEIKIQFYKPMPISSSPFSSQDYLKNVTSEDKWFIVYRYGIIFDKDTGLEWIAGPDRDLDWLMAKNWIDSLKVAGGGWRMPTLEELETRGHIAKHFFKTTGWLLWSGENKASSSDLKFGCYDLDTDEIGWSLQDDSSHHRGIAVRLRQ